LGPDGLPNIFKIKNVLQEVLDTSFEEQTFETSIDSDLCQNVTDEAHRQVGHLIPKRFRFIIQTILAEKHDQDMAIGTSEG
jgi:hypothetical protein